MAGHFIDSITPWRAEAMFTSSPTILSQMVKVIVGQINVWVKSFKSHVSVIYWPIYFTGCSLFLYDIPQLSNETTLTFLLPE